MLTDVQRLFCQVAHLCLSENVSNLTDEQTDTIDEAISWMSNEEGNGLCLVKTLQDFHPPKHFIVEGFRTDTPCHNCHNKTMVEIGGWHLCAVCLEFDSKPVSTIED